MTKEEKIKENKRNWYHRNKEKVNAKKKDYAKKWYIKSKERLKVKNGINKDRISEWHKQNYSLNKESLILNSKLKQKQYIENLNDVYVKNLLKNLGFKSEQITPELIELKRITLKTERLCLQLKN